MKKNLTFLTAGAVFFMAGPLLMAQQKQADSTNTQEIQQVVLIGYGQQKKQDLTGSISTVQAKDFNPGATSVDQLITGKVAGVNITGNSGAPGAGSTIRIRGGASLNGNNAPLIVIDGVPMDFNGLQGATDPLSLLNPDDIASFTILKDASAAAIYGNRASNGVIIITTKKGRAGQLHVDFNSTASVSTKEGTLKVLSANQFRKFVNEQGNPLYIGLLGSANTNWQDQIYQKPFGSDNELAVSGGLKWLPYRLSLGYTDQGGILKTNQFQRTSVGLNLNPNFFQNHLAVSINLKGTQTHNRFPDSGAIGAAEFFDPTQPVLDDSARGATVHNYWEWWLPSGGLNANGTANPLGLLNATHNTSNVKRGIGRIHLDYKVHFLPDLHVNVNAGYDYQEGKGSNINYNGYRNAVLNVTGGTVSDYFEIKRNKLLETYLNYVKEISAISTKVDLVAGYSYQKFQDYVPSQTTHFGNPQKEAASQPSNQYKANLVLLSYYGRGIFTIADKYIITASVRRDASSRFYNGTTNLKNMWGTFPAVSAAWKMKDENFLKDSKVFSDLKLRIGYGETGQQVVGSWYNSFPAYNISQPTAQYQFGDKFYTMYRPSQFNPDLTWETTGTFNVGVDYGFLKNRLTGSIDLYNKNTWNLLAVVPVPAGEFSNTNVKNIGRMNTRGIEVSVNAIPIQTEKVTWNVSFNASKYKADIRSFSDQVQSGTVINVGGISGGVGNTVQAHAVGHAPFSFYVFQQVYDATGKPLPGVYVDRNGDGKIDNSDKYFYKSTTPSATFGFSTSLNVGKWDFSTSLRAVLGNYVYNNFASQSNIQSVQTNSFMNNIAQRTLDYGFSTPQYWSDIFVENASFLRMDNATLGYSFGDIIKNTGNLRVFATAQNVFTVTRYSGIDPEVFGNIDNGFYQRPRIYSLGLSVKF